MNGKASAGIGGLLLLLLPLCIRAQQSLTEPLAAPTLASDGEIYLLRIENVLYGRVEASVDGGEHYVLLGRVERPATVFALDKAAVTPGVVLRSGGDGLAFAIGQSQVLKLRPRPATAPSPVRAIPHHKPRLPRPASYEPEALVTNLPAGQGLWKDILPPPGSMVRVQLGESAPQRFYEGYTPSERDAFVFAVRPPIPPSFTGLRSSSSAQTAAPSAEQRAESWKSAVAERITEQAKRYLAGSLERAKLLHLPVVNGTLTLHARLSDDESDISAVTYAVDGDIVAIQNARPFQFAWDTRRAGEGEHVIEIRACNSANATLTRVRRLVVVHNAT